MWKLWKWYQNCLSVHPLMTQIFSSGVLWGIGDISAQYINHCTTNKNLQLLDACEGFSINWRHTAITSIFGIGFVGPVGHIWYEGLDKVIRFKLGLQPKTVSFVAAKVTADGIIFGPIDLLIFFSYIGFANGKNFSELKDNLKRDFLPALVLEGGAWPILQVVNFRYVPVRYQLLYVNMLCLVDCAFLSWLEQQKDAAWKQWFAYPSLYWKKQKDEDG